MIAKFFNHAFEMLDERTRLAVLEMYDTSDPECVGRVIAGYDKDHAERTSRIAVKLGNLVGLDTDRLEEIEIISLLHDLGRKGMEPEIFGSIFGLALKKGLPVRIRELRARYPQITESEASSFFLDLLSPALHDEGIEITPKVIDHIAMRMNFKGRLRQTIRDVSPRLASLGINVKPRMEKVMLYYYYPELMEDEPEDVRIMGMILVTCENFEAFNNWRRGRDYYRRSKERLSDVFEALLEFQNDNLVTPSIMDDLKRLTASGDLDDLIKESRGSSLQAPLPPEDIKFQQTLRS